MFKYCLLLKFSFFHSGQSSFCDHINPLAAGSDIYFEHIFFEAGLYVHIKKECIFFLAGGQKSTRLFIVLVYLKNPKKNFINIVFFKDKSQP